MSSLLGGLSLAAVCSAGCGGLSESAQDVLFAILTDGEMQRSHACEAVRRREFSLGNGHLPLANALALHDRISAAGIEEVKRCLAEVQAYNACFLALPCDAFSDRGSPVWMGGPSLAPCGCGVSMSSADQGPFAVISWPTTLSACAEILPVVPPPPPLGFSCSE